MSATANVTAIVTAYQRIDQTLDTLRRLEACVPSPDEILVHVDSNEINCAAAVRAAFPQLTVILSESPVGPGGGRNKLIAAARNDLIASFDDDSYPIDPDYFNRARVLAETFPNAALFSASIFHRSETCPDDPQTASPTPSFGAGGVVLRRSDFLAAGGFVPLVIAYGMEEEDLALRLYDRGSTLLRSPWLRVFHDTDLSHHASSRITSGTIANIALLAWLRYPPLYWPYGALQVVNRVIWCVRVGRFAGVIAGLVAIPRHLARHRTLRCPVSTATMRQRHASRNYSLEPFNPVKSSPIAKSSQYEQ